jgi:hypothetical protein
MAYVGCLAAAWLAGCGDSEDTPGGGCAPLVACGGNLVGQWQVDQTCVTQTDAATSFEGTLPPECVGSLTSAEVEPVNVLIAYTADGSWTTDGAARSHLEYTLSSTCLSAINADFPAPSAAACTLLGDGAQAQLATEDPEGTASCAFAAGACDCETTFELDTTATGTYTIEGSQFVIEDEAFSYCVSGDRLEYGDASSQSSARRN